MTSLNHNLRRIICYTPYSEPVWPKRRNTVRTWTFERLRESETFCSVDIECEDGLASTTTCSVHLPDPSFRLPTWLVRLPPWAYKREVTPLQRVTTETTTTTYEITSWFQSLTPPKSTPSRPATIWSNSLNPWNYFPAHESFVRSLILAKEFIFEIWSSCSAPFNNYEDGC
jgi:hypothetical protein